MSTFDFTIELAGIPVCFSLLHEENKNHVTKFVPESEREPMTGLKVTEEELDALAAYEPSYRPAFREYCCLPQKASTALLPFDRMLIHGLAFVWQGRTWLFAAPSGTGKTTQFYRWKELYPDEVEILNGDKPILEFRADGEIWVHNSPWQGKEGIGKNISAPLAGIIYLAQAKQNKISLIPTSEAVIPVFAQLMFSPDSAENVHKACQLEERMLNSVPVYYLENLGDAASARLTHDFLLNGAEDEV